jgi:OFA family oxalate/formate antiporter-like MFS transporter
MLVITYGFLYGLAVQLVLVPLSILPAAWFPEKRGLVIGIVMGAYGLSALLITPLQTWFINPGR